MMATAFSMRLKEKKAEKWYITYQQTSLEKKEHKIKKRICDCFCPKKNRDIDTLSELVDFTVPKLISAMLSLNYYGEAMPPAIDLKISKLWRLLPGLFRLQFGQKFDGDLDLIGDLEGWAQTGMDSRLVPYLTLSMWLDKIVLNTHKIFLISENHKKLMFLVDTIRQMATIAYLELDPMMARGCFEIRMLASIDK